jgi:hypothetical protein
MFKAENWMNEWLLNQKVYQNITQSEKLQDLLTIYLDEAEKKGFLEETPNQGTIVKTMIDKPDLNSKAVIFHELVELEVYLAKGHTEEEIANWTAHDKSYLFAHNIAEKYHLNLIKDAFQNYSGQNIPLEIILISQPILQEINPSLDFASSRINNHARNTVENFHKFSDDEVNEYLSQIKNSMQLFEEFGGIYNLDHTEIKIRTKLLNKLKKENNDHLNSEQRKKDFEKYSRMKKEEPIPFFYYTK